MLSGLSKSWQAIAGLRSANHMINCRLIVGLVFLGATSLGLSGCGDWNPITPTIQKTSSDDSGEPETTSSNSNTDNAYSTNNQPGSYSNNFGSSAANGVPPNGSPYSGNSGNSRPGAATAGAGTMPPNSGFGGSTNYGNDTSTFGGNNFTTNAGAETIALKNPRVAVKEDQNGYVLGFSIDYQFNSGRPNPNSRYVLEVSASGNLGIELFLDEVHRKGSMIGIAPGWKPDYAPFSAVIVERHADGRKDVVSPRIEFPERMVKLDEL